MSSRSPDGLITSTSTLRLDPSTSTRRKTHPILDPQPVKHSAGHTLPAPHPQTLGSPTGGPALQDRPGVRRGLLRAGRAQPAACRLPLPGDPRTLAALGDAAQLPFPTEEFAASFKLFGIVTNRTLPGDQVIWWLRERCGKSEEAVMKTDLAGCRAGCSEPTPRGS